MEKIFTVMQSPIGPLTLACGGGSLTHLLFGGERPEGYTEGMNELLGKAMRELEEYFAGKRREFDLPLDPRGTEFQLRVWSALRDIPYGQIRTYKDIAIAAGCPKGYRAVGMANHQNPISIILPCHRVVGSGGGLTGYGGGLPAKEYLLGLERKFSQNGGFYD